jgi:CRP-like cAMP-binding protein
LSLRDTLGNLFAGLALEAQRPFDVGDWIAWDTIPAHIGQVVEINWRATKVVTLDAVEITIPHGTLGQGMIVNYSEPRRWSRRSIYFHAPSDIPTHRVHKLILEAIAGAFGVLSEPPPSIVTTDFDDRGVKYWLRFFTAEFDKRDIVEGEVRDRIWYSLNRAGIAMPVTHHSLDLLDTSPEARARKEQEHLAVRVQALRCVDFFNPLAEEVLHQLAGMSRQHHYAPGEVIIRQGEPGDELFIVRQGEVIVSVESPGHSKVEVARMGPGEFFGEMSLLTGEPRSAMVSAGKACEVLVVGKVAFGKVLEACPELAERVTEIIVHRRAALKSKRTQANLTAESDEAEWSGRLLKRIKDFFSI